jgi:hypothetical protein
MFARRTAALATASLMLAGLASPLVAGGSGSWLIDRAKYHVSPHGQLSCATCHDAVASSPTHPDPANVNQPAARPDSAEGCLGCHEAVQTALDQGKHGRMTKRPADRFRNCVACHNPHTILKRADRVSKHVSEAMPPEEQCGACHEARQALPKPAEEDAPCLSCHAGGAASRERDAALCLHCHGGGQSEAQVGRWMPQAWRAPPMPACLAPSAIQALRPTATLGSRVETACSATHDPTPRRTRST